MNCHRLNRRQSGQRGIALLLMMIVLFTGGSAFFLSAMNNRAPWLDSRERLYGQFELGKEALLAHAVNYADFNPTGEGPGRLPCPAAAPTVISNCSAPVPVPESHTLTLPDGSEYLRSRAYAGVRQALWLSVSDAFVVGTAQPVNTSGNPDDIVASIHENSSSDLVLNITRRELMSLVTVRVAHEIKGNLDTYYSANGNTYPSNNAEYETAMTAAVPWYSSDEWNLLANYNQIAAGQATLFFNGCDIIYTLDFATGLTRNGNQC